MNLYVGEMRDDESQEEFIVLVGHRVEILISFNFIFLDEQVFRRSTPFPNGDKRSSSLCGLELNLPSVRIQAAVVTSHSPGTSPRLPSTIIRAESWEKVLLFL